jgi:flagellar basal-body rod protein FlgB
MDLNKLPLLAAMMRRLDWLQRRHEVLAGNIANSDTPGFRPKDLEAQEFRALVGAAGPAPTLAATQPGHVRLGGTAAGAQLEPMRPEYEASPSGNAVVLEQQMMLVAETQMEHQTITNLYRKHIGMLKTALGRRGP